MPTRRRRCQPRSRKTLLELASAAFPAADHRRGDPVNNFKATGVASVSKVIHTDNSYMPDNSEGGLHRVDTA